MLCIGNTLASYVIGWLVLGSLRRRCVDICRKCGNESRRECKEDEFSLRVSLCIDIRTRKLRGKSQLRMA